MKYINIECSRFSYTSSSNDREDHHIELVVEVEVEVDERDVISQFSAKLAFRARVVQACEVKISTVDVNIAAGANLDALADLLGAGHKKGEAK
jgi:hypothetical protein